MKKNKRILLASPRMMGNERKYVRDAFKSNWIAPLGPYVNKLEDEIGKYMEMDGTCALSSGTAALHLAIKLAGVKEGDYVFCSSLTFSASANPIMYEKAIPVFIDSEPGSYNMSPVALEKAFMKYKPKAVIIVSLYGMPATMDALLKICKKNLDLWYFEEFDNFLIRRQIKDSFVKIEKNEAFLYGMHISPYEQGNRYNHKPDRIRKLLLNKKEILKIS